MSSSTTRLGFSLSSLITSLITAACGPSLASLHDGARAGRVQTDAPLHARQTIEIAAPRERVWQLLTDVAGWPRWQSTVTDVSPPPALEPGAAFTWVNGGTTISSRLAAVRPMQLVAWTGSVSVAKAVHVWHLSSPTPGTTRVEVEETMDGFLLTWFYKQAQLDAEIARSLVELRAAAEARP